MEEERARLKALKFEALKQEILAKQQSPSKFFIQLKQTLESEKKHIDVHAGVKRDPVWLTRSAQVKELIDAVTFTEQRAINFEKLLGTKLYDDSVIYAECAKHFGHFSFLKDFFENFWQNWGYRANSLPSKIDAALNSDPSTIYLNAQAILQIEEEARLQKPEAKRLQEVQAENDLLKQQLAEMNNQVKAVQAIQLKMQKEFQSAQAKTDEKFQKMSSDYQQLLKTAESFKQQAAKNEKKAIAHDTRITNSPKQRLTLFHEVDEKDHDPVVICPINRTMMTDPVFTLDGTACNRDALERLMSTFSGDTFRDPITRNMIAKTIVPGTFAKNILSAYTAAGSPRKNAKDPSPERTGPPSLTLTLNPTES